MDRSRWAAFHVLRLPDEPRPPDKLTALVALDWAADLVSEVVRAVDAR